MKYPFNTIIFCVERKFSDKVLMIEITKTNMIQLFNKYKEIIGKVKDVQKVEKYVIDNLEKRIEDNINLYEINEKNISKLIMMIN